MFNINIKSLDFSFDKISVKHVFLSTAFVFLFYGLFQDKIDKYVFPNLEKSLAVETKLKMMSEQRAIKQFINHELSKVCKRWDAGYSAINLFSNGDSTFNGFHFEKMSREFEGMASGKMPLSQNIKSWSTDPFIEEINYLEEHQVIYYSEVEKEASVYMRKVLAYYNVQSVIYVAYMKHGYISGYMTIEFNHTTNFKEEEKTAMMKELKNIRSYIDKYNKNKSKLKLATK